VYDEQGRILPRTLYGVYKLANEGTARVYWQDERVASIGLRPFSVYGPGRDQGVTADPTHAMRAAARRQPYRIGFGGKTELHYAPDVAHAFLLAAQAEPTGAFIYDFPGEPVSMAEVVAAIEAAGAGGGRPRHLRGASPPLPGEAPGRAVPLSSHPSCPGHRGDGRALPAGGGGRRLRRQLSGRWRPSQRPPPGAPGDSRLRPSDL